MITNYTSSMNASSKTSIDVIRAMKNLVNDGQSITKIANELGLTRSYVSRIFNGQVEPSASFLFKFRTIFPDNFAESHISEPSYNYNRRGKSLDIRYYDTDIISNMRDIANDKDGKLASEYFSIPAFNDCDYAINISGQDMEPIFCRGDIVLCNKVNDRDLVNYGDPHLVVTDEMSMVKYLFPTKDGQSYLLRSANEHYPEWTLKMEKVKYLYRIKGVLRRKIM